MRKLVETHPSTISVNGHKPFDQPMRLGGMVVCALAFVACILLSATPLNRLGGADLFLALPTNPLLLAVGGWLPIDFGLTSNARSSQMSTHILLFVALVALEFLIYGACAWWIQRQAAYGDNRRILRLIWLGTVVAGLIFVLTPAMLSHDAFVYAGYGRLLAVHQANPYFTALSAYPRDPFFTLDDWRDATAAYGPLWLAISALGALFAGDHPLSYVLLYRVLGLIAHLLNILLVIAILRTLRRSPRTIAMGALLYAWNPLVLQESCLGGHNDTFMVTLILLGILCCTRAEQREGRERFIALRGYLPALVAFTVAMLIKFTSAPLLALFLALLLRTALYTASTNASASRLLQWQRALLTVIPAGAISAGLVLLCYLPFWIGHPLAEVARSFLAPPSANSSFGSIFSAIAKWVNAYGLPDQSWLAPPVHLFSLRQTWQYIPMAMVALTLLAGCLWLWRVPTTRTLALSGLAALGGLLIVTPWFFPWYVCWLVGLAAICLPVARERMTRALIAGTLAFSASAHFIYYFRGYAPLGDWIGLTFLTTIGPPILALLVFLCLPISRQGHTEGTDPSLRALLKKS